MTLLGYIWIGVGINIGLWFLSQVLTFIIDFITVFKNYLNE